MLPALQGDTLGRSADGGAWSTAPYDAVAERWAGPFHPRAPARRSVAPDWCTAVTARRQDASAAGKGPNDAKKGAGLHAPGPLLPSPPVACSPAMETTHRPSCRSSAPTRSPAALNVDRGADTAALPRGTGVVARVRAAHRRRPRRGVGVAAAGERPGQGRVGIPRARLSAAPKLPALGIASECRWRPGRALGRWPRFNRA